MREMGLLYSFEEMLSTLAGMKSECPICYGEGGEIIDAIDEWGNGPWGECGFCLGIGEVDALMILQLGIGDYNHKRLHLCSSCAEDGL